MTTETEKPPNLIETDITDLWRKHQEHKDAEDWNKVRRVAARDEVLRRGKERGVLVLPTDAGDIIITPSNTYAYNPAIVDKEFYELIVRDGLEAEWAKNVRHTYHIDKRWLNRLAKQRGEEYGQAIDKMTTAGTGSPSIKGPSLEELGGYAEEVPEEALQI